MSDNLSELFRVLPSYLSNHLLLVVLALLVGVAISVPLAILVVRVRVLRFPALTAVSVIQTIPSLALLALMVPVVVGIGLVTSRFLGLEISQLGFLPAIIALTLYCMLPIVRNTVTGITGVPADMTEAARGLGMTGGQILRRVELPLAAPVILAGIRTATVWTVGMATLATPVGQTCLGNYIFQGLQTRNWASVIFGCVGAAVLAITLDFLLGGLERAVESRNQALGLASGIGLLLIIGGGLVAPQLVDRRVDDDRQVVWVGSKTFTEQYILAHLISDVLEDAGVQPRNRDSLGSTIVFDGLVNGEIDVYVDYSGTIWANHMKRSEAVSREEVLDGVTEWLDETHGVRCLGSLGFENAYGLAMRRAHAELLGVRTIADLVPHASTLKIGGDYEFFGRPEWVAIREGYGLDFAKQVSFDSTLMYGAVANEQVDVISAFTSDGRIAAFDLVILEDPRNTIPPYDAILLLSRQASERPAVVEALRPLVGAIPVEQMREANHRVDRDEDKQTVHNTARWLREQISR